MLEVIILIILAIWFALAVTRMAEDRKKGRCACCGCAKSGCAGTCRLCVQGSCESVKTLKAQKPINR